MKDAVKVCAEVSKETHAALAEVARREKRSLSRQVAYILEENIKREARR